jgi:hypothetical protein
MNEPDEPKRYDLAMQLPATADKPLNGRQEAFAQAIAKGLTLRAAYREAGYGAHHDPYRMLRFPNVAARIAALQAETAATARIQRGEIVERLLAIIARCETSDNVAAQNLARQALMDLAKMHGYLNGQGEPPKPPPSPITEIRRVLVYPDGREEAY